LLEEVVGQGVILKEHLDSRRSKNGSQDGDQSENYYKTGQLSLQLGGLALDSVVSPE
jgi:hypothetical protein